MSIVALGCNIWPFILRGNINFCASEHVPEKKIQTQSRGYERRIFKIPWRRISLVYFCTSV